MQQLSFCCNSLLPAPRGESLRKLKMLVTAVVLCMVNTASKFNSTTRQFQNGHVTLNSTANPFVTTATSVSHACMQCEDTLFGEFCIRFVSAEPTFCLKHDHLCPLSCKLCQPCVTNDVNETPEDMKTLPTRDNTSMSFTTRDWFDTTSLPETNTSSSFAEFNSMNSTASFEVLQVMVKLDELFKGKRCNDTAGTTKSLKEAGCKTLWCQYSSGGFMHEVSQPGASEAMVSGIVKAYGYTHTDFTTAIQQIWINYVSNHTKVLLPWVRNVSIQVIVPNVTFAPAELSTARRQIPQSATLLDSKSIATSNGPNATAPIGQVDASHLQKHIQNDSRRMLTVNVTFGPAQSALQEDIPQSANSSTNGSFASKGQNSTATSAQVDKLQAQNNGTMVQNTRSRVVHFKLCVYVLLNHSRETTTSLFPTVDNFTIVPDMQPFVTTTNMGMEGEPFFLLQLFQEYLVKFKLAEEDSRWPLAFVFMMIIVLICFVVLYIVSGIGLGIVLSCLINRFYLRGNGRLVIRRIKFAILSGKVFFSQVTFTSKNRVITVHRGAMQFHLFKVNYVDKRRDEPMAQTNRKQVRRPVSSQQEAEVAGAGKFSEHNVHSAEKFRLTVKLYCVKVVLLNNSGKYEDILAVKKRSKPIQSTQQPNSRSGFFKIVPAVSWEIYHGCVYAATSRHHLMWAAHFRRAEGVVYDLDCPPETRHVDRYRVMTRTVFEKARILLLSFGCAELLEPDGEIVNNLSRGPGPGVKTQMGRGEHAAAVGEENNPDRGRNIWDRVRVAIRSLSRGSTNSPNWDETMTEEEFDMAMNSPGFKIFLHFLSQDPKKFEQLSHEEKQQLMMQFQAGSFVDTGANRGNIVLEERVRKVRALFSNSVKAAGTGLSILSMQTKKAVDKLGLGRRMEAEDNEDLHTDQQDRAHDGITNKSLLKKENDTNKNEVLVVDRIDMKYFYDVPGLVTAASAEMAKPPQMKLYLDFNREKLSKTKIAYGPHCERFRKLFIRHFYPTNYSNDVPWYQPQVGDLRTIEEWTIRFSLFGVTEFIVPYSSIDPAVVAAAAKVKPALGAAVKKASEDAKEHQACEWLSLEFEEDAGEADVACIPRIEVQYPLVRRRSGSESVYTTELYRVKMYSITNTRHSRFYAPFPATTSSPTNTSSTPGTLGSVGQHQRAPSSASTSDWEDVPTTGAEVQAPQNLGGFGGGRGAPLLVTPTLTIEYISQLNRKWNAVYKNTTTIVLHKPTIQLLRPQIGDLSELLSEWSSTSDAVQQLLFTPSRYAFMLTAHDAEIVMNGNANNVCDLPFHPDYNNLFVLKVPLVEVELQTPRDRFQPRYSQFDFIVRLHGRADDGGGASSGTHAPESAVRAEIRPHSGHVWKQIQTKIGESNQHTRGLSIPIIETSGVNMSGCYRIHALPTEHPVPSVPAGFPPLPAPPSIKHDFEFTLDIHQISLTLLPETLPIFVDWIRNYVADNTFSFFSNEQNPNLPPIPSPNAPVKALSRALDSRIALNFLGGVQLMLPLDPTPISCIIDSINNANLFNAPSAPGIAKNLRRRDLPLHHSNTLDTKPRGMFVISAHEIFVHVRSTLTLLDVKADLPPLVIQYVDDRDVLNIRNRTSSGAMLYETRRRSMGQTGFSEAEDNRDEDAIPGGQASGKFECDMFIRISGVSYHMHVLKGPRFLPYNRHASHKLHLGGVEVQADTQFLHYLAEAGGNFAFGLGNLSKSSWMGYLLAHQVGTMKVKLAGLVTRSKKMLQQMKKQIKNQNLIAVVMFEGQVERMSFKELLQFCSQSPSSADVESASSDFHDDAEDGGGNPVTSTFPAASHDLDPTMKSSPSIRRRFRNTTDGEPRDPASTRGLSVTLPDSDFQDFQNDSESVTVEDSDSWQDGGCLRRVRWRSGRGNNYEPEFEFRVTDRTQPLHILFIRTNSMHDRDSKFDKISALHKAFGEQNSDLYEDGIVAEITIPDVAMVPPLTEQQCWYCGSAKSSLEVLFRSTYEPISDQTPKADETSTSDADVASPLATQVNPTPQFPSVDPDAYEPPAPFIPGNLVIEFDAVLESIAVQIFWSPSPKSSRAPRNHAHRSSQVDHLVHGSHNGKGSLAYKGVRGSEVTVISVERCGVYFGNTITPRYVKRVELVLSAIAVRHMFRHGRLNPMILRKLQSSRRRCLNRAVWTENLRLDGGPLKVTMFFKNGVPGDPGPMAKQVHYTDCIGLYEEFDDRIRKQPEDLAPKDTFDNSFHAAHSGRMQKNKTDPTGERSPGHSPASTLHPSEFENNNQNATLRNSYQESNIGMRETLLRTKRRMRAWLQLGPAGRKQYGDEDTTRVSRHRNCSESHGTDSSLKDWCFQSPFKNSNTEQKKQEVVMQTDSDPSESVHPTHEQKSPDQLLPDSPGASLHEDQLSKLPNAMPMVASKSHLRHLSHLSHLSKYSSVGSGSSVFQTASEYSGSEGSDREDSGGGTSVSDEMRAFSPDGSIATPDSTEKNTGQNKTESMPLDSAHQTGSDDHDAKNDDAPNKTKAWLHEFSLGGDDSDTDMSCENCDLFFDCYVYEDSPESSRDSQNTFMQDVFAEASFVQWQKMCRLPGPGTRDETIAHEEAFGTSDKVPVDEQEEKDNSTCSGESIADESDPVQWFGVGDSQTRQKGMLVEIHLHRRWCVVIGDQLVNSVANVITSWEQTASSLTNMAVVFQTLMKSHTKTPTQMHKDHAAVTAAAVDAQEKENVLNFASSDDIEIDSAYEGGDIGNAKESSYAQPGMKREETDDCWEWFPAAVTTANNMAPIVKTDVFQLKIDQASVFMLVPNVHSAASAQLYQIKLSHSSVLGPVIPLPHMRANADAAQDEPCKFRHHAQSRSVDELNFTSGSSPIMRKRSHTSDWEEQSVSEFFNNDTYATRPTSNINNRENANPTTSPPQNLRKAVSMKRTKSSLQVARASLQLQHVPKASRHHDMDINEAFSSALHAAHNYKKRHSRRVPADGHEARLHDSPVPCFAARFIYPLSTRDVDGNFKDDTVVLIPPKYFRTLLQLRIGGIRIKNTDRAELSMQRQILPPSHTPADFVTATAAQVPLDKADAGAGGIKNMQEDILCIDPENHISVALDDVGMHIFDQASSSESDKHSSDMSGNKKQVPLHSAKHYSTYCSTSQVLGEVALFFRSCEWPARFAHMKQEFRNRSDRKSKVSDALAMLLLGLKKRKVVPENMHKATASDERYFNAMGPDIPNSNVSYGESLQDQRRSRRTDTYLRGNKSLEVEMVNLSPDPASDFSKLSQVETLNDWLMCENHRCNAAVVPFFCKAVSTRDAVGWPLFVHLSRSFLQAAHERRAMLQRLVVSAVEEIVEHEGADENAEQKQESSFLTSTIEDSVWWIAYTERQRLLHPPEVSSDVDAHASVGILTSFRELMAASDVQLSYNSVLQMSPLSRHMAVQLGSAQLTFWTKNQTPSRSANFFQMPAKLCLAGIIAEARKMIPPENDDENVKVLLSVKCDNIDFCVVPSFVTMLKYIVTSVRRVTDPLPSGMSAQNAGSVNVAAVDIPSPQPSLDSSDVPATTSVPSHLDLERQFSAPADLSPKPLDPAGDMRNTFNRAVDNIVHMSGRNPIQQLTNLFLDPPTPFVPRFQSENRDRRSSTLYNSKSKFSPRRSMPFFQSRSKLPLVPSPRTTQHRRRSRNVKMWKPRRISTVYNLSPRFKNTKNQTSLATMFEGDHGDDPATSVVSMNIGILLSGVRLLILSRIPRTQHETHAAAVLIQKFDFSMSVFRDTDSSTKIAGKDVDGNADSTPSHVDNDYCDHPEVESADGLVSMTLVTVQSVDVVLSGVNQTGKPSPALPPDVDKEMMLLPSEWQSSETGPVVLPTPDVGLRVTDFLFHIVTFNPDDAPDNWETEPRAAQSKFAGPFSQFRQIAVANRTISALTNVKEVRLNLPLYSVDVSKMERLVNTWIASTKATVKVPSASGSVDSLPPDERRRRRFGFYNQNHAQRGGRSYSTLTDKVVISINFQSVEASLTIKPEVLIKYKLTNSAVGFNKQSSQQKMSLSVHLGPHQILFAIPQGKRRATTAGEAADDSASLDDEWKQKLPQVWVVMTETHPDLDASLSEMSAISSAENAHTPSDGSEYTPSSSSPATSEFPALGRNRQAQSPAHVALTVSVQKVSNRFNPEQLHQLLVLLRLLSTEIMQVLKRAAEFSERAPGKNFGTAKNNDQSTASTIPITALIREREYQVDIQLQGIELELLTRYRLPDHRSDDECGALVLADTGAFHLSLKSKELNLFGATTEGSVTFTGTKVVLIPQTTNPSYPDISPNARMSDVPRDIFSSLAANVIAEDSEETSYSQSPRPLADEAQHMSTSSLPSANITEPQKPTRKRLLMDAVFFVEVGSLAVIQQANGDTSILIQETNCIALPEMMGTMRRLVEELASHGRDYSELLNRQRLQTPRASAFSREETHRPEELRQLRTDIAEMDVQIRHIWKQVKPDLNKKITAFRKRAHNTLRFFMEDTAVAARFTAVKGFPHSNELRSFASYKVPSDCLVVHLSTLGGRAALSTVGKQRRIRVQLQSKDLYALTLDNVLSNVDVFACINQSLQKARTDDGASVAEAKTSVRRVGNRLSTNRVVLPAFKSSLRVSVARRDPPQQDISDGQNIMSHLCITISSRVNILGPKVEINPTIVSISRSILDSWNLSDPKLDNRGFESPEIDASGEPTVTDAEQLQQMTDDSDSEPNGLAVETQTGHADKSRFAIVVETALNIMPGRCRFYNNKSVEIGYAPFSQTNTADREDASNGLFTPRLNRFDRRAEGINYWEMPLPEANLQFRKHLLIGFRDAEAAAVHDGAMDKGAFQVGLDRVWVPPRVMLIMNEFFAEVNRAKQRMFQRHLRQQKSSKPETTSKVKEQPARDAAQSHKPTMAWVFRVLPCFIQFTDCPIPKANKPMRDEDNVEVEFSMRKSLEFCLSTSHVQTKVNASLMVQSSTFRLPELRLTLAKTDEDKAFAAFTISEITMHCNQAYGLRPNTHAPMTTVTWNVDRIQLLVNMQSCDKMLYLIDLWKLDIERAKAARESTGTDPPNFDGSNDTLPKRKFTEGSAQTPKRVLRKASSRSLLRSNSQHNRSGRQPTSASTAEDEETDGSALSYQIDEPTSGRSSRASQVGTVDSAYIILRVTIRSMKMMVDANDWIGSVLKLHAHNLSLLCDDRGFSAPVASKNSAGNFTRKEPFVVTAVLGKLNGDVQGKLAGTLKIQSQSGDHAKAPLCFQFIRNYRMLALPLRSRRRLFGDKCAVNYFAIQLQAMQLQVNHNTGFDARGLDTETLLVIDADGIGAKWRDVPVQYLKILHDTNRTNHQSVPTVEHVLGLLARKRRKKIIEWCVQLSTNFKKVKVNVGARIAPTLLRDVHKVKVKFKGCQQYATRKLQRKVQNTVNRDPKPRTSVASSSSQLQSLFNDERVQTQSSKFDVAVGQMKGNVNFCEIDLFHDNINQKAITILTNVSGEIVSRPRLKKRNVASNTADRKKGRKQQPDELRLEIQRSVKLQLQKGDIKIQCPDANFDGDQVLQLPSSEALITSTERDSVVTIHEFITRWKQPIVLHTDIRRYISLVKVIKGFLREVKNNSRLTLASTLGSLRTPAIANRILSIKNSSMDDFDLVFDEDSASTPTPPKREEPNALEPNERRFDVSACHIDVRPTLNLLGSSTPSVSTVFEMLGVSENKFVKGSHELICSNVEKTLKILMKISTKMDGMFDH